MLVSVGQQLGRDERGIVSELGRARLDHLTRYETTACPYAGGTRFKEIVHRGHGGHRFGKRTLVAIVLARPVTSHAQKSGTDDGAPTINNADVSLRG